MHTARARIERVPIHHHTAAAAAAAAAANTHAHTTNAGAEAKQQPLKKQTCCQREH